MSQTQTRTLTITPRDEREIVMTRAFDAPRRLVFDAWTKPELSRRWFGPRSWQLMECEIDLREGGSWRYVMHGPEGAIMVMHGVFAQVVVPERLVSTESFDDDWTGGETLVTSAFDEHGGVTTVTSTTVYASRAARDAALESGMERGVAEGYDRLAELLALTDGLSS